MTVAQAHRREGSAAQTALSTARASPDRKSRAPASGDDPKAAGPPGRETVADNRGRMRFIEALIAHQGLAAIERLVGVRLALFLNLQTGQLNPSFKTIANSTGISDRSAKRHVQALVDAGWVTRESRRGRVSNAYGLILPTVPTGGTVR